MYLNPIELHVDGNYAEIMTVHLIFKISVKSKQPTCPIIVQLWVDR